LRVVRLKEEGGKELAVLSTSNYTGVLRVQEFAIIRSDYVVSANEVGTKELFKVEKTEKPRKTHDKPDIERLVDAL
jgi:hypothetical protein